jgi:DNA-binding transcriptional LysR family regulator
MQWSDRVGRRLKPRDLHIFAAVAELGNMARAAERLAVSRPVVSKTISELEHTLGVPLFDRSAKGVVPTLYGQALLRHSAAIFDELRQSVKEIEFLARPDVGRIATRVLRFRGEHCRCGHRSDVPPIRSHQVRGRVGSRK